MDTQPEVWAYAIMSAVGYGSYEGDFKEDWPGHDTVIGCMSESLKEIWHQTEYEEDGGWCEVPMPTTKWCAEFTKEQWEAFRAEWFIEPDNVSDTLGMIYDIGMFMWALAYESDGMDWNMGGITPVNFVQLYFCCQDPDMMERAGIEEEDEGTD